MTRPRKLNKNQRESKIKGVSRRARLRTPGELSMHAKLFGSAAYYGKEGITNKRHFKPTP